jgi:parallel beta-helix repeat protein
VTNCTLSGNFASGGHGGDNDFYGVSPGGAGGTASGGCIYNLGALALTACTIAGNGVAGGAGGRSDHNFGGTGGNASGGGIYQGGGSISVRSTLIADNGAAGGRGGPGGHSDLGYPDDYHYPDGAGGSSIGPDVSGSVTSPGFNLIGQTNASGGWVATDLTGSSAAPVSPNLGPLADNGGQTYTMALLDSSPALFQGNGFGLTSDQRGLPRPAQSSGHAPGGDGSSIGAYEAQAPVAWFLGGPTSGTEPLTVAFTNFSLGMFTNFFWDFGDGATTNVTTNIVNHTYTWGSYTVTLVASGPSGASTNTRSAYINVSSTNITVLNTNDSGNGSLRQAIANVMPNGTITFGPAFANTIRLSTELTISNNVSIIGPGAKALAISGSGASRIFSILAGAVSISGLTVNNGHLYSYQGGGGAILNAADLTLGACALRGNTASGSPAQGGAIYNSGRLTLTNCAVSGNSSVGDSPVCTNGCNGGDGLGGGIYNSGTLWLTNCTLSGNSAFGGDGGDISDPSISRNGGSGGAAYGGAIYNQGVLALTACTIASNGVGGGRGGGSIFGIGGPGGNASGAGIYQSVGSVSVRNTIVAGNSAAGGAGGLSVGVGGTATGPDLSGAVASAGFNLIGQTNASAGWIVEDLLGSTAAPLSPNLGPLADNGGPTYTMALLNGSPAVYQGNSFALTSDQRGAPRPSQTTVHAPGGDGSSIGAYEVGSPAPPPPPRLGTLSYGAGTFQFDLTGQSGAYYIIQASTNLAGGNWLNLSTNLSPFTFTDTNASLLPGRFYRALPAQ